MEATVKLLFFDDYKFGVMKGDNVVDCSDVVNDIPHVEPQNIISGVIENWDAYRPKLEAKVASSAGVPLSSVRVHAPSPKPRRVVCMAVNYNDGMAQTRGADAFHKSPDAIIGDGDTMVLGDIPATVFEGEAELALVIGKKARNVAPEDAESYIFGYTNFIDGSARGMPIAGFYSMKSRATYAPIGPFIVTKDEIADPNNLRVRLWNNEELMQDYTTADMATKIPDCIAFVTKAHEMEPGDILALGTNHRGLHPFQDGQSVELETEGLGRLHIKVQDDLKRTWERQTRIARKEAGLEGLPPQLTGKYA
jgi:2-keto-4-pentenoate hydratase/2-oxohepta-3-ene-1,7-dioic acid hydratase in catechol pathway